MIIIFGNLDNKIENMLSIKLKEYNIYDVEYLVIDDQQIKKLDLLIKIDHILLNINNISSITCGTSKFSSDVTIMLIECKKNSMFDLVRFYIHEKNASNNRDLLLSKINEILLSKKEEENRINKRLDEVEDMVKYLPIVGQGFIDAKSDFDDKVIEQDKKN